MSSVDVLRDPVAADNGARGWPRRFRPMLDKLAEQLRLESDGREVSIEPIRELARPFSNLLHIRITRDGTCRRAFLKVLHPRSTTAAELLATQGNVRREYDVTCRVREVVRNIAGLEAVVPIACFAEDFALVTEEAIGHTLSTFLGRHTTAWSRHADVEDLCDALRLASRWLLAAQRGIAPEREVSGESIWRYLERRINELSASPNATLTGAGRDSVARCRDRLLDAASREGIHAAWIHADFCPDNIVVNNSTVAVLDFTMAGAGTRYHDLAHLFLGLDALKGKPWLSTAVIDRLQAALLHGFEPDLDLEHPLFVLARFQHVLCHMVTLQGIEGRVARLRTEFQRRRYRAWLSQVSSIGAEGWAR